MGIEDKRRALIGKALLTSSDLFLLLFSNADTQQQPSVLLQDTNKQSLEKAKFVCRLKRHIELLFFLKKLHFFLTSSK